MNAQAVIAHLMSLGDGVTIAYDRHGEIVFVAAGSRSGDWIREHLENSGLDPSPVVRIEYRGNS